MPRPSSDTHLLLSAINALVTGAIAAFIYVRIAAHFQRAVERRALPPAELCRHVLRLRRQHPCILQLAQGMEACPEVERSPGRSAGSRRRFLPLLPGDGAGHRKGVRSPWCDTILHPSQRPGRSRCRLPPGPSGGWGGMRQEKPSLLLLPGWNTPARYLEGTLPPWFLQHWTCRIHEWPGLGARSGLGPTRRHGGTGRRGALSPRPGTLRRGWSASAWGASWPGNMPGGLRQDTPPLILVGEPLPFPPAPGSDPRSRDRPMAVPGVHRNPSRSCLHQVGSLRQTVGTAPRDSGRAFGRPSVGLRSSSISEDHQPL